MVLWQCTILAFICFSYEFAQAVPLECKQKSSKKCIISMIIQSDGVVFPDLSGRTTLQIKGGELTTFDANMCDQLKHLQKLQLGSLGLKELCLSTDQVEVSAAGNQIDEVKFSNSDSPFELQILDLRNNALKSLNGFYVLKNLIEVHLENNALEYLDWEAFKTMSKLERLYLNGNKMKSLTAKEPTTLPFLEYLSLANNQLTSLDVSNWHFDSLVEFDFSSNNLSRVDHLPNKFQSSQVVHLANNQWYCKWLQDTLQHFNETYVTIKGRDEHCEGITSANICCTPESDILHENTEWKDKLEKLETGHKSMQMDLEMKFSDLKRKNELTSLENQLMMIVSPLPEVEIKSSRKNLIYDRSEQQLQEIKSMADLELKQVSVQQEECDRAQQRLAYMIMELRKSLERSKKTVAGTQTLFDQLRANIGNKLSRK